MTVRRFNPAISAIVAGEIGSNCEEATGVVLYKSPEGLGQTVTEAIKRKFR